ncbi:hypothetical protein NM680_09865 [Paracoccus sp. PS-1]|uniref:ABC transporter substrate-binding protein n=1 Tax=unclassified Paracoccus (in: a-proteobacteria) TaxID=2688777 RepID=UPI00048B657D|nr:MULTISPECIES: hypothetical protein [unclassified Paracoccus (in: a-proteobacteria)]MDQ7262100.1 hypothetical protein [Paracoccus sp. PS1]
MKPIAALAAGLAALLSLGIAAAHVGAGGGQSLPPATPAAKPRVASTALCGDMWVLALADRDQILSLSRDAAGPSSPYAGEAAGLPRNRGSLEELIAGDAGLVVTGQGSSTQMRRVLGRFGIAELDLGATSDLQELADKIPQVGKRLGQPERGKALRAAFLHDLAAAADPGRDGPVVAYYRPDGGGAGAGTIVDAALSAAGYRNMQRRTGPAGWGGIPLEQIVMTPPGAFVVSYFDTQPPARNAGLGRNPVLRRAAEQGVVLPVPGKLWPCDHPVISQAVTLLAGERVRLEDAFR